MIRRTRRPDIFGPAFHPITFGRQTCPLGIDSVTKLPNLTQGLFERGYSEEETAAILSGNWLRSIRSFCG